MPAPAHLANAADPARGLWAPVTVRVAWDLVLAGVPARPEAIAEAREHALRSLPPGVGQAEAEELASVAVAEWLERLRSARYRRPSPDPDLSLPLTAAWRRRLCDILDHAGDAVFRLHFGDGFPVEAVARSAALDLGRVEVARGGIREAMRTIAMEEGLSVQGWPAARLDALIGRVARLAEPGCPGPGGLLTDEGRAHADRCPRCSRAVRLIRGGVLSPGDLFPPEGQPVRPTDRRRVAALLLHPDARRHHAAVCRALGELALPVGQDGWLLADEDLEAAGEALRELALDGRPARHHLRGALVSGSGRWVRGRLLGPLPHQALEAARARPWGEIMGVPELPPPLPPPPKATRWWGAAALAVALAVAAGAWVLRAPELAPSHPVRARFVAHDGGWEARFDTPDLAVVDLVVRRDGRLELVETGVRQDKGRWATGEGDYKVELDGEEALIVTSAAGIPELEARLEAARQDPDPIGSLVDRIRAADGRAGVARSPHRP